PCHHFDGETPSVHSFHAIPGYAPSEASPAHRSTFAGEIARIGPHDLDVLFLGHLINAHEERPSNLDVVLRVLPTVFARVQWSWPHDKLACWNPDKLHPNRVDELLVLGSNWWRTLSCVWRIGKLGRDWSEELRAFKNASYCRARTGSVAQEDQ